MLLFIEILFKMLFFEGGVLIYADHCIYIYIYIYIYNMECGFMPNFLAAGSAV